MASESVLNVGVNFSTPPAGEKARIAQIVLPIEQSCKNVLFENVQKNRKRRLKYSVLLIVPLLCILAICGCKIFRDYYNDDSEYVEARNNDIQQELRQQPKQLSKRRQQEDAEKAIRLWKLFSRNDFVLVDNRFNAEDALEIRDLHPNNLEIVANANTIIKQQFTSFSKSNRFLSLPLDHLLEILYWDDLAVSSEEVVFTAAIRWLTHEMERQKFAPIVLEAVRLPLLSANFLHTTVWNNQIVKECEECRDMVFNALAYHADASSSLHQRNARIRQPPRQFYAFSRDADTHYERFNTAQKRWEMSLASKIAHKKRFALTNVGPLLYVIGGNEMGKVTDHCQQFDVRTNKTFEIPSMTVPRDRLCAVSINQTIYAIGGWDGSNSRSSLEKYTVKNGWTKIKSMDKRRYNHACSVLNGKIYVFGGYDGTKCLKFVECFDPSTEQWKSVADMPTPRSDAATVVFHDKIYVLGGSDCANDLKTVEIYNPRDDKWSLGPSLMSPRIHLAALTDGNLIYAFGGSDQKYTEVLDPAQKEHQQWIKGPEMKLNYKAGLKAVDVQSIPKYSDEYSF